MGTTPLHAGAQYGYWKVVDVLIRNKAVINAKDRLKRSALGLAEKRSDEDLYKKIRKGMPYAYPNADYDKVIKILKISGGK